MKKSEIFSKIFTLDHFNNLKLVIISLDPIEKVKT